jgi:formyltetrahydrofolate synthetase
MQLTAVMLLSLEEHARKIGTLDNWIAIAKEWIEGADEHINLAFHPELGWAVKPEDYERLYNTNAELEKKIAKMTPVYSAVMEWTGGEASLDALKHIVKVAKNDTD